LQLKQKNYETKNCKISLGQYEVDFSVKSEQIHNLIDDLLKMKGVSKASFSDSNLCVNYQPDLVGLRDLLNQAILFGF